MKIYNLGANRAIPNTSQLTFANVMHSFVNAARAIGLSNASLVLRDREFPYSVGILLSADSSEKSAKDRRPNGTE